jgi:phage shock protein A
MTTPKTLEHPLVIAAMQTFGQARNGLAAAMAYQMETHEDDVSRMRVALGAVASACEALKSSANALGATIGHVSRAPKETQ